MIGDSPEADVGGGHAGSLRLIWISRRWVGSRMHSCPEFTMLPIPEAPAIILCSSWRCLRTS